MKKTKKFKQLFATTLFLLISFINLTACAESTASDNNSSKTHSNQINTTNKSESKSSFALNSNLNDSKSNDFIPTLEVVPDFNFTSEDNKYTLSHNSNSNFVNLKIPKSEWDSFVNFKSYQNMNNQESKGMKDSPVWTNFIYQHLEDKYDFIVYVLNTDKKPEALPMNGYYQTVKNDIKGIGTPSFGTPLYDYSKLYGSEDGNLQGLIYLTHNDVIYDGPILHELMHRWGNYILNSDYGSCHWGDSNIFGRLGGYKEITSLKNGDSKISTYKRYWGGKYSQFELYLMGLIPKEEVPDIEITSDYSTHILNQTLYDRKMGQDIIVKGNVSTKKYTIEDIILGKASDKNQKKNVGERVPSFKNSKKDFNILFVALDYDDITEDEKTLINNQINYLCEKNNLNDNIFNFWEACSQKSSLSPSIHLIKNDFTN